MPTNPEPRFWSKVHVGDVDACWLWFGTGLPSGYGLFTIHGKLRERPRLRVLAHRYSYELVHGPIPAGIQVNHHCDTPPCVNPRHLYGGTPADNIADAVRRGRVNPIRKLTAEQVREVRSGTETNASLARRMGVDPAVISRIRGGLKYTTVL